MSQNLKLVYFDVAGKAEAIRLALKLCNIEFEDVRLTAEEFSQYKSGKTLEKYPFTKLALPFGQLPVLIVDDNTLIAQSISILRYIGKRSGHYPIDNDVKAAKIDSLLDFEKDILVPISLIRYPSRLGFTDMTPENTQAIEKELSELFFPVHFATLEKLIGSGPYFFSSDEPSIADFSIAIRLNWLIQSNIVQGISSDILEPFPKLRVLIDKVTTLVSETL